MSGTLSFALACHVANGEKVVIRNGTSMSEGLAASINLARRGYSVHPDQLRATDEFIQVLQQRLPWQTATKEVLPEIATPQGVSPQSGRVALKVTRKDSAVQQPTTVVNEGGVVDFTSVEVPGKSFKPFRLRDLPYELRHLVFEYAIEQSVFGVFLPGNRDQTPTGPLRSSIANTGDRKHDREAMLWLASVDFSDIGTDLKTGFDAIHSLSFPYFSRFPYQNPSITVNNNIQTMLKCKDLRHVSLSWVYSELIDAIGLPKSVATLRANYRLDGMLDLKSLKTLRLKWPMSPSNAATEAIHALGQWFADEYGKRGMDMKVTFE